MGLQLRKVGSSDLSWPYDVLYIFRMLGSVVLNFFTVEAIYE